MTNNEELSPSLENLILLTWLRLIKPALPKLVKQRYGTELITRTLSSIKPDISQALDSLLDEITSAEDARVMRAAAGSRSRNRCWPQKQQRRPSNRNCPQCKQAGRKDIHHFLSECPHLPEPYRDSCRVCSPRSVETTYATLTMSTQINNTHRTRSSL